MADKNFKGIVEVYNEKFFLNTLTGEGIDKILKKLDGLLTKKSKKVFLKGYTPQDIKQELTIMVIEGIKKFDFSRGVKLSSFLHAHLNNKIISEIHHHNRLANDACAYVKPLEDKPTIYSEAQSTQLIRGEESEEDYVEGVGTDHNPFFRDLNDFERLEFRITLEKLTGSLDYKTRKIIEMVYFEDYTVKDAAEKLGLTGWAGLMRLKQLTRKQFVRELFNQPLNE